MRANVILLLMLLCGFVTQAKPIINPYFYDTGAPILSVTTDASATPSTTLLTITGINNAFRVWTGDQPTGESSFYLYIVRNGGTPVKAKMYRWSGRIFTATTGDTIALGTSDGRALKIAQMRTPTALTTPSGVTGTANCDKAGPPIWAPAAAHIILPTIGSTFQLNENGSERDIFISEYDGSQWSPARWVRVPAAASVRVQCTYKAIALGNYTGATISVTAPTGSSVGGSMSTMSLTFPTITGTTHNVTTVSEFMTAVGAAVAGDEIVFADGTYALTNNLIHSSFTANEAAGNRGPEGIVFRSLSGNRANVILSRSSDTTGGWKMDQTGNTGKTTWFKDFTIDGTCSANTDANAYGWRHSDGSLSMQNVRVTGLNLKDSDNAGVFYHRNMANSSSNNVDYLFCQFDTQSGRLLSFTGFQTNSPTGTGSDNPGKRRVIACDVFTGPATAAIHNMLSLYRIDVSVYGGSNYDAEQWVFGAGYNSTNLFCWTSFPQAATTARSKNQLSGGSMFGCRWTTYAGTVLPSGGDPNVQDTTYQLNNFVQVNASGSLSPFGAVTNQNFLVEHNIFTGNTGQALITLNGGSRFNGNICTNLSFGLHNYAYSGSYTTTLTAIGNTFRACQTAIYSTNNAFAVQLTNNVTRTSNNSIITDVNGMAVITSDYNVFDPTVSASYTAGANDITGSDAGLDSNNFPTAAGNCDGNGDTAAVNWVGDSDPFGLVLIYKASRVSRGARDIPAIYSSAELFPDYW